MGLFAQKQRIYEFSVTTIDGYEKSLADFEGSVLLIVNVASRCGLTPQYEDLQKVFEKYQESGLVILGFPANNFMGQEPGTDAEIKTFCTGRYGVTFPMFSKISVKGKGRHPLYAYLEEETAEAPSWNFHKYLVDRQGEQIISIPSSSRVVERPITEMIEKLLSDPVRA